MHGILVFLLAAVLPPATAPHRFLTSFSLRDTVCSLSHPALDCSGESGGGMGAVAGGSGGPSGEYSEHVGSVESFAFDAKRRAEFDEKEFLVRVEAATLERVRRAGFEATASRKDDGFTIRYADEEVTGEIDVTGGAGGQFYSLELDGKESGKQ